MNQNKLISLISTAINQPDYKFSTKGEILFWCPICNKEKSNKKLSINLNPQSQHFGKWHCWVCETSHNVKGTTVQSILKFFNVASNYYEQLQTVLNELKININGYKLDVDYTEKKVFLPDNSISFTELKNNPKYLFEYKNAINYLQSRGIDKRLIEIYNFHLGLSGNVRNRIIIPSYDTYNSLNYYTARAMIPTKLKYVNPDVSKNVIIFENMLNFNYPLLLVEGMFDAISARRNSTALMGKNINEQLFEKILITNVPVILCLDKDAIKTMVKIIPKLVEHNIETYYVLLDKKDPNEIGFENFIKNYYKNKIRVSFDTLIKLKLLA